MCHFFLREFIHKFPHFRHKLGVFAVIRYFRRVHGDKSVFIIRITVFSDKFAADYYTVFEQVHGSDSVGNRSAAVANQDNIVFVVAKIISIKGYLIFRAACTSGKGVINKGSFEAVSV